MQATQNTSPPRLALNLLRSGGFKIGPEWERAHELCQLDEGDRDHDLVHALCHWIEGDEANRDYWYRRVAPWHRAETMEAEWDAVAAAIG